MAVPLLIAGGIAGAKVLGGVLARQAAQRAITQGAGQVAKQRARSAAVVRAKQAASGATRPKGMASPDALRAQRARDLAQAARNRRTQSRMQETDAGIRSAMRPGNAPVNRPVQKPVDGGLRSGARDQRALSGKVTTRNIGPKPKRADYKTDQSYQSALKKWDAKKTATPKPVSKPVTPKPTSPKPASPKASTSVKKPSAGAKKGKQPAPVNSKGKELVPAPRSAQGSAGRATRDPIDLKNVRTVPGATSGEAPRAIGSAAAGREVAVRSGSTVAKRPGSAVAVREGQKKGGAAVVPAKDRFRDKMVRQLPIILGTTAAAGILGDKVEGKKTPPTAAATDAKPSAVVKDKYGRKISRAEYNRREKFRQKLAGAKSAEQAEKFKKAEGKRRSEYRKGEATQQFGADAATKKVKNQNVRAWKSVRDKNRSQRASKEGTKYTAPMQDGRRFR
jgi:hypothetical protein